MNKRCLSLMCAITLLFCSVLNVSAYTSTTGGTFDVTGYVTVNSTQEAINALLKCRADHKEMIVLRADPSKVKIECDIKDFLDLDASIYNSFHYGYTGGLYNSMDYDVNSGPSCYMVMPDSSAPGYNYYQIWFEYSDNDNELAAADAKLRSIMSTSPSTSTVDRITTLYNWMKTNLPASKDSKQGYSRNCNGIYGCLFGDGTGFCCSTYACTIQRYCELAGINAYILGGAYELGEICHAFNVIEINGKWYVIDYAFDSFLKGKDYYSDDKPYKVLFKKYMAGYKFDNHDYEPNKESESEHTRKPSSGNSITKYMLSDDGKSATVIETSNIKTVKIANSITHNRKKSKVTSLGKKCVSGNKVRYIVIDAKYIQKVNNQAFTGSKKLKKVTIKSLKKSSKIARKIEKAAKKANKKVTICYKKK